jgi:hypothetical protein
MQAEAPAPTPTESAPVTETAESPVGDFFNSIEAAFEAANIDPSTAVAAEEPAPAEPSPETAAEPVLPVDEQPTTEPEPEALGGKAGRRFKQLKTELKQVNTELELLRTQLQERETLLQELRATTETQGDYKQQLAEYEQALAVAKLEAHPQYKREVEEPMTELVQSAETIAERYGIDADELIDVLAYSDREKQDDALDRLLQGVKERDKLAVYALAEQVPYIAARRDELQTNAQAALAELAEIENRRNQESLAQRLEERRAAAKDVQRKLVEKVPFLAGLENLNLDNLSAAAADTDFDGLGAHHKVYAKMAGDLLPTLAREYVTLRSELEEALDELESFKKVDAKTGAGAAANAAATRPSGSFLDAINAALGGR